MQLIRLKLEARELEFTIPTSWNELTPVQLLYIGRYWEAWKTLADMGESLRMAKSRLIIELAGLTTRKQKVQLCNMLSFVDESTSANIYDFIEFIFTKNIKLTRNLLPKIKVGMFTWYYGPGDRLSDLTLEEFSFAFSAYMNFSNTGVEMHLNNLCAILYRPKNDNYLVDGQRKLPFKVELIHERVKRTRKLKLEYKYAVYLFFYGCIDYLANHKKYRAVFRKAEQNENAGSANFIDTARQMSGPKLGSISQALDTNLYIFLAELADVIKHNKKK